MTPVDVCHRQVIIDGKNYRTVSDKCWTTSRRLADFADIGLTLQAISPMPELLSYWLNPTYAAVLVRYLNDHIAAMLLPRLEQAISVFPALRESVQQSPTAQARQFFYDTLVFDDTTLKHLVHCFGDTQLMIGTDYPFNFHDDQPVARLEAASLTPGALQRMTASNASRFLGLPIPISATATTSPTSNPRPDTP